MYYTKGVSIVHALVLANPALLTGGKALFPAEDYA
jgi:hypothetical protein